MAKRTNPFTEDYITQSKIHVSLKQFNNNEDRLKKVYEKTLELLFKGANKSPAQDVICNKTEVTSTIDRKDKMRQLFIGKNGTLLHSGNMVQHLTSMKLCKCGTVGEVQCAYCEVSLCLSCLHTCCHCERAYCTSCMLIELEGKETCVSCYS